MSKELIGFRGWDLTTMDKEVGPVLKSPSQNTLWPGPVLKEPKFQEGGSNGIYSLKKLPPTTSHEYINYFSGHVYGAVELSGTVVEAANGYRAEIATVRRLWLKVPQVHNTFPKLCRCEIKRCLELRYQCDIEYEYTSDTFPEQPMQEGEFIGTISGHVIRLRATRMEVNHRSDPIHFYGNHQPLYISGRTTITIEGDQI